MHLLIDKLRDPEEKELQKKLSDWLATDTILDLMATVSGNSQDPTPPAELTPVNGTMPEIAALINSILSRLGINFKDTTFYIAGGEGIKTCCRFAFSPAGYKEYIILSARLFELLTEDEMRAVIAHEAAHLYFGHHRLTFCIDWLNLEDKQGRLYALASLYHYWQQLAELTADRVSLLAVTNPQSAITCLARRNLRKLTDRLDLNSFLTEQRKHLEANLLFIPRDRRHPPWEFRALALESFRHSSLFQAMQKKQKTLPKFPPEIAGFSEHLKVTPDQQQFAEFCFLLAAGNYLIGSDRHIHKAEINRLRDILARLIHTPGPQMINGTPVCASSTLAQLGKTVASTCPARREPIFELLSSLMVQDGRIAREEKEALDTIGLALSLQPVERAKIVLKVLRREFHPVMGS